MSTTLQQWIVCDRCQLKVKQELSEGSPATWYTPTGWFSTGAKSLLRIEHLCPSCTDSYFAWFNGDY